MPPPVLTQLCESLDRLVWSGLQSGARADELSSLAGALEAISAQVPSASRLAVALRRCLTLPAMEAAPTLLKLAVAARQLRAQEPGLPAVVSGAAPLPAPEPGPPHHALPPLLLAEVRGALRRRTAPTQQVLAALAEPATAGEVRLWPLLDRGLENPSLRQSLVELAVRIGPAMAGPLQRRFNRRGGEADAARLIALTGILGVRIEPLLRTCILKGSLLVELAALESLGRIDPQALPGLLCERFDRAGPEARVALLPLLASVATEATLERLLAQLSQGQPFPPEALARIPETKLPGWLERLSHQAPELVRSAAFIELLESRPVGAIRSWLREACQQPDARLRRQAAEALLAARVPEDLAFLAERGGEDETLALVGITALFSLGEAQAFEVLAPRMAAWSAANPPDVALPPWLSLVLSILGSRSDRRWAQRLAPLAAEGRIPFIRALTSLGDPGAVAALAQASRLRGAAARHAVHGLGELGIPEALPPLLHLLQRPELPGDLEVLLGALAAVGDARAVAPLEALRARPEFPEAQRPFVDAVLQAVRNRERKSP